MRHIDFTQDILNQLKLMEIKKKVDYDDGIIDKRKLDEFLNDLYEIRKNNSLFKSQNPNYSGGADTPEMPKEKEKKVRKPRTVKEKPLLFENENVNENVKEKKVRKPRTLKEKPLLFENVNVNENVNENVKEKKVRKPRTLKEKPLLFENENVKEKKVRKPRTLKEKPLLFENENVKEKKVRKPRAKTEIEKSKQKTKPKTRKRKESIVIDMNTNYNNGNIQIDEQINNDIHINIQPVEKIDLISQLSPEIEKQLFQEALNPSHYKSPPSLASLPNGQSSPFKEPSANELIILPEDNPRLYYKAITEYVNNPVTNVIVHTSSFELASPNKKISKTVYRRIMILFFATMLAIKIYANPNHRKHIPDIFYIFHSLRHAFFTSIKFHVTDITSLFRLASLICIKLNAYDMARSLHVGTTDAIMQKFQPYINGIVLATYVVKKTAPYTNGVRKEIVKLFDKFIDVTYDNFVQ